MPRYLAPTKKAELSGFVFLEEISYFRSRKQRKINFSLVFFSLNCTFAYKIEKSGREEVKFTREDKHS